LQARTQAHHSIENPNHMKNRLVAAASPLTNKPSTVNCSTTGTAQH
jgi:hypothetical protein